MKARFPPLSALRPFEAAARLESFSRAADELHLTHGAVSHQVRALEEHLGSPLFLRHGKRVSLTQAGRAFADSVRKSLAEIARAAEALHNGRMANQLTISVMPSFASRWLMPRLIGFIEKYPDIVVSVSSTNALANFASGEADVAIRFGQGPWPGLACEKILEDEYFPVASPKLGRGKLPRTPKDILAHRVIREDGDYWIEWFAAAGVDIDGDIEGPTFTDATHTIGAATRGEGIALARPSLLGDDLERGTLKRLFKVSVKLRECYWIVCPRELVQAPKVKAFRDWVKSELKTKAR
jgi:LysR family transcriptional regulator, glycine cleavage system transcriptional activator